MDSSTIPRTSGIYKITCTVTGKFYIGSAINLRMRQQTHWNTLTQGVHHNRHLQNAWNKYGLDAFTFEVLELVLLPEMLTAREQYFLDTLNPFGKRGFNISPIAGSNLGVKYSPLAIEKSRIARIGMKRTQEQCENIGASRRGKPSPLIGYKAPPKTIEKLRISHRGKKQSEDTRLKKSRKLIVIAPDGTEYVIHGIGKFCREHNLHASALRLVAQGKYRHHKGWTARFPDELH